MTTSTNDKQNVCVLGTGAWGTAIALLLNRNQHNVRLWGYDPEEVQAILDAGENKPYLPGYSIPKDILVTNDLKAALDEVHAVFIVVPSHAFRAILKQIKHLDFSTIPVAWLTKGLEHSSGKLLHQVFEEELGEDIIPIVVSGPSFANEVAANLPTAVTVASDTRLVAEQVANLLRGERFRPYVSEDIIGVQLGGAVKNILAIAAGVSDGLKFGANARAALITRGLAEITRLGIAMGGEPETFMGLAGAGDLILTCTDNQSRNRRFGLALARGLTADEALKEIGQVVEGMQTAKEIRVWAKKLNVEMPICEMTYRVIFESMNPMDAVHELLTRATGSETD